MRISDAEPGRQSRFRDSFYRGFGPKRLNSVAQHRGVWLVVSLNVLPFPFEDSSDVTLRLPLLGGREISGVQKPNESFQFLERSVVVVPAHLVQGIPIELERRDCSPTTLGALAGIRRGFAKTDVLLRIVPFRVQKERLLVVDLLSM
jgi:hypothetical protein